jgi:hypothetical protein
MQSNAEQYLEIVSMKTTVDEMRRLSYYTLCKLSDACGYTNPIDAVRVSRLDGVLTMDALGNFKRWSPRPWIKTVHKHPDAAEPVVIVTRGGDEAHEAASALRAVGFRMIRQEVVQ